MQDLDQDTSCRHHDEWPELRVVDDAESDLNAGSGHRLTTTLDPGERRPPRTPIGARRLGEPQRHAADVGLVLHARRHRLHRDRPADLVRGGDRARPRSSPPAHPWPARRSPRARLRLDFAELDAGRQSLTPPVADDVRDRLRGPIGGRSCGGRVSAADAGARPAPARFLRARGFLGRRAPPRRSRRRSPGSTRRRTVSRST